MGDRKRISNDRSVQHHRKLDGLDCNGYHPLIPANRAFKDLIEPCVDEDDYGSCPYSGPIGCWNTSLVTDMNGAFADGNRYNGAFADGRYFNDDISAWVTSSVTSMVYMFANARDFNQPVDSWDVSSVTNMRGMFRNANRFNQPVDSWDVSSVTNM